MFFSRIDRLHFKSWTTDLTWALISAIEEDEDTLEALFPGVGAIAISGGKPKTHFHQLLAKLLFEKHPLYMEAYAKAVKPIQLKAWRNKIKNRIGTWALFDYSGHGVDELILHQIGYQSS